MKHFNFLAPVFDIGDEVSFLNDTGAIVKALVKNITTTHDLHPKVFYQCDTIDNVEVVLEETSLLFANTSHIRPLFSVGTQVKDMMGNIGTILGMCIDVEDDEYTVTYTLDEGEILDEEEIVAVIL